MRRNVYRVSSHGAPFNYMVLTLPTLCEKTADCPMQKHTNRPIFGSNPIPEQLFTGAVNCANGGKFTPGVKHELEICLEETYSRNSGTSSTTCTEYQILSSS